MEQTKLSKIPYPSEDADPFFDDFVSMMEDVDQKMYGFLSSAGNVIIPADNIVWNASQSLLSWDNDFIVSILSTNRRFLIRFGPDGINSQMTINDGDKVVIQVPTSSADDVVGKFSVVSGAVALDPGVFVFGMRVGNKFYANLPTSF